MENLTMANFIPKIKNYVILNKYIIFLLGFMYVDITHIICTFLLVNYIFRVLLQFLNVCKK